MSFKGTVVIAREEEWFVATCLENNVASQGKTIDQALENLKEAIELYYEDEDGEALSLAKNRQVYVTTLETDIGRTEAMPAARTDKQIFNSV